MAGADLRRIRWLSVACAVVIIGGLVSTMVVDRSERPAESDDAESSTTSSSVVPRPNPPVALLRPQTSIVGDELWVYRGRVAALGTAPPISLVEHPDWTPNRWVTVYGADGSILRQFELRLPSWAQVSAIGDDRYIIDGSGPIRLQRVDGHTVEEIPLTMPEPEPRRRTGYSRDIVATSGSYLWLDQFVSRERGRRLVAIDVTTGDGMEIALPGRIERSDAFCADDRWIYSVLMTENPQQTENPSRRIEKLTVFRHPLEATDPDWEPVGEIDVDQPLARSSVFCAPAGDALLISHAWTMSTTTGSVQATSISSPDINGVIYIGILDGAPIARSGLHRSRTLLRLEDSVWQPIGEMPEGAYRPSFSGTSSSVSTALRVRSRPRTPSCRSSSEHRIRWLPWGQKHCGHRHQNELPEAGWDSSSPSWDSPATRSFTSGP